MKKKVLVILLILTFSSLSFAQIVVDDKIAGTIVAYAYGFVDGKLGNLRVGGTGYSTTCSSEGCFFWKSAQGVIEFDLAGLPTSHMTENNFTAKLNGIDLSSPASGGFYVDIFDLSDFGENYEITESDWNEHIGDVIRTVGSKTSEINDLNITEQLRRDLFGEGEGDDSSGFIFISQAQTPYPGSYVIWNANDAQIEIKVAGSGGDDDCGGCGAIGLSSSSTNSLIQLLF